MLSRILFLAYTFFVAFVSLLPGSGQGVGSWDKVFHFLVYGIFAYLGSRIVVSNSAYIVVCLGIIFYGGLMEVGQSFVPGRDMSAYDLLANTAGVLFGALIVHFVLNNVSGKNSVD